jgi:hypothetical protein
MNIIDLNDHDARKLFADLTTQAETIRAKAAPLRAKRDKLLSDARDKELALNAEIKAIEKGLADIDVKRGRLVKLLNGKTGIAPPADQS